MLRRGGVASGSYCYLGGSRVAKWMISPSYSMRALSDLSVLRRDERFQGEELRLRKGYMKLERGRNNEGLSGNVRCRRGVRISES